MSGRHDREKKAQKKKKKILFRFVPTVRVRAKPTEKIRDKGTEAQPEEKQKKKGQCDISQVSLSLSVCDMLEHPFPFFPTEAGCQG